jgi:aldehyde dehydrogenase (NAD+)
VRSRLAGWMQPRRVPGVPNLGLGRSEVQREARGVTLILSPWNYPLNLALAPLVGALAAGNTAILKPSEKTPATSALLQALISESFPPSLVQVVQGGAEVAQGLLKLPFDHVFFTGSTQVGKEVMAAAARNLASVTLELGGKSPAIVDASADLDLAAKRIAWGKFINAGQTCVATDYVLVHESVAAELERRLPAAIEAQYGDAARQRTVPDYGRIIDAAAVARLRELTRTSVALGAQVVYGGEFDEARRYVSPTVLTGVTPDMPVMQQELFGPVLPLLRYRTLDDALQLIRTLPKPLALYLFSSGAAAERQVREETSSGALVVNGTVVQFVHPHLPFGGVGASGQGSYHGEYGFRAFSHERAVLHEPGFSPTPSLYPPFGRLLPRLTSWALRKLNE